MNDSRELGDVWIVSDVMTRSEIGVSLSQLTRCSHTEVSRECVLKYAILLANHCAVLVRDVVRDCDDFVRHRANGPSVLTLPTPRISGQPPQHSTVQNGKYPPRHGLTTLTQRSPVDRSIQRAKIMQPHCANNSGSHSASGLSH
jgi:hypothetical protein